MRYRLIVFVSALIISISSIHVVSFPVYASEHGGGGSSRPADSTSLSGFENWPAIDKAYYFFDNLLSISAGVCGIIFNPLNWNYEDVSNLIRQHALDTSLITSSEDYFDWVAKCLSVNDEGELIVNDELADAMYQAVNVYIEEYTGWYNYQTIDYKKFPSANFPSQGLYNAFLSYCSQQLKGTDKTLVIMNTFNKLNNVYYFPISNALEDVEYYTSGTPTTFCMGYITQDWNTISPNLYRMDDTGIAAAIYTSVKYVHFGTTNSGTYLPITDGTRTVRVYKSLEDLKSYSVGQRPYYYTSKFQDYDINGDNSCIISESQLNGSSVYGDVINYIIEYPDSDGLTEDELRDILDDYFKDKEDDDDSGSGSGGSGGSGLGGFLDGIGAIGDALLGILGKLLEYVGKAIDLLSETVTKVIDIIPKNITALLGGIFPFLPEEWLTAIELSLVLAVIVGIVRIFKG